jgi:DNA modification methylase
LDHGGLVSGIHASLTDLSVPLTDLTPLPGNPRRGDVDAVVRSYSVFGQRKPIVARRTGERDGHPTGIVIAGNHQLAAAEKLGWPTIAAVWTDDDEMTAKAFALADNRTSELGVFDDADLAAMLGEVAADAELLAAASYSEGDLLALLNDGRDDDDSDEPAVPALPADPRTQPGDLWLLGDHRVVCGDCRDPDVVARLMDGQLAQVAFTSPPYADRRVYDESSGFRPIPPDEYVDWFGLVQSNVRGVLAPDGSWFVNVKPGVTPDGLDTELYVLDLVVAHVRRWGWHFATEFCWERTGVPKNVTRRFKNQFEPVYQFTLGDWKMRPDAVRHRSDAVPIAGGKGVGDTSWANAQGGNGAMFGARKNRGDKHFHIDQHQGVGGASFVGEYVMSGMAYPGNRLPSFAGTHEATGHTAAFPVGLPGFFVKAYTDPGDRVFDPFLGSGSTLLAADREGRRAYGCEISPGYVDVICRRYQDHTGEKPVLEATGEPHDFSEGSDG